MEISLKIQGDRFGKTSEEFGEKKWLSSRRF